MTPDPNSINVSFSMTPEEARDFLERLENDEDFRRRLESEPLATLRSYGISIAPDAVPSEVRLPSRAEIARVREELEGVHAIVAEDPPAEWWYPFFSISMLFRWYPYAGRGGGASST